MSKSFQIWDYFFPFLFPQGFGKPKNIGHWTSGSGGKKTFEEYGMKKIWKTLFFPEILHRLWLKNFKSEIIFFHYFPQRILKIKKFGHWTLGSGGKKINGVRKPDGQTNKQTNTHMDILTYRKNWPKRQILWKYKICKLYS